MSTEEPYSGPACDYEVGNKKPPKHSQYKPGVSGPHRSVDDRVVPADEDGRAEANTFFGRLASYWR
jgi:hypothetical protein